MKYFDEWNRVKRAVRLRIPHAGIRAGSIWICSLGINVGFEINGKGKDFSRPVLVVLSFGKNGAIVLPMTTQNKNSRFFFKIKDNSFVNLSQIRFLDSRRFIRYSGKIGTGKLRSVIEHLYMILKNENPS